MMKNDEIVREKKLLLAFDIHVKIGIGFVQIVEGDSLEPVNIANQALVDAGFFKSGMREEEEKACHVGVKSLQKTKTLCSQKTNAHRKNLQNKFL